MVSVLQVLCVTCLVFTVSTNAMFGWDAHRVSAAIAEKYLTPRAWNNVLRIIANETLVDVCT